MSLEVWKDVPGFEGLYEVSTLGRVRSLPRKVVNKGSGGTYELPPGVLTPQYDKDGYLVLNLKPLDGVKPRNVKVHRLVALAFLPNPEGLPEVDHKNRDRADARASNLRWAAVSLNRRLPEYDGKGVRHRADRPRAWQAYTKEEGKFKSIGTFFCKEDAVAARMNYITKGAKNGDACTT